MSEIRHTVFRRLDWTGQVHTSTFYKSNPVQAKYSMPRNHCKKLQIALCWYVLGTNIIAYQTNTVNLY